jgi:hypothetical protein
MSGSDKETTVTEDKPTQPKLIMQTIYELWPKAKFSPSLLNLYRKKLTPLDRDRVILAIENVKCKKYGSQPELSWILAEYESLLPKEQQKPDGQSEGNKDGIEYQPTDNPYEDNWNRIKQVWPSAMFPTYLKEIFDNELRGLNQDWLTQAIGQVKCKFSSHQPELAWFLKAYERIEERAWASQDRKRTPVEVIIVDHVRVRDGRTSQVSTVFTNQAEAEAFAQQQNGTIRGQRKATSDDELRVWLKAKTRPELQAAVDLVRKQGWGEWQFPADIDKWTATMLGAVAGGLDVIERRRAA